MLYQKVARGAAAAHDPERGEVGVLYQNVGRRAAAAAFATTAGG